MSNQIELSNDQLRQEFAVTKAETICLQELVRDLTVKLACARVASQVCDQAEAWRPSGQVAETDAAWPQGAPAEGEWRP